MAKQWHDLSIESVILTTINEVFGFEQLTPVQEHCIPLFLTCKDVAVEAVTGSGMFFLIWLIMVPFIWVLSIHPISLQHCLN